MNIIIWLLIGLAIDLWTHGTYLASLNGRKPKVSRGVMAATHAFITACWPVAVGIQIWLWCRAERGEK